MALSVCSPSMGVGRLVVRSAVCVEASDSIRRTAAVMREANVSSALLSGYEAIVTERDLAHAWAAGATGEEAVATVASEHPLILDHTTPICEAAAIMLNREVRHLVVGMEDDTFGVVSLRAVMGVLLQALRPELWLATLRVSFMEPPELFIG